MEPTDLERWHAEGRAAWPELPLAASAFARALREAGAPLPLGHVTDFYLACACAQQVPGAAPALERSHFAAVARAIARACESPAGVDEVMQELRETLLVARPG